MKKIFLLCFCVYLWSTNGVYSSVFIIGNDTIHFENGSYFTIGVADTFSIDTSMIFVKYESSLKSGDIASIESQYGLSKETEYPFGWISYTYNPAQKFLTLSIALNNEPLIDMIEFNTSIHYLCEGKEPNDFEYLVGADQWYLDKIEVPYAWTITTGDPDIIVAILDTGFDWEHDDLGPGNDGYDNIYLNQDENNGGEDAWDEWDEPTTGDDLDNDDNDCTDDWKGWGEMYTTQPVNKFYLGNDVRNYDLQWLENMHFDNPRTLWMHGTLIAGIIGAKTNNGIAIAGIAGGWNNPGTSMLLFKTGVSDKDGSYANRVAYGIQYAVDKLPRGDKAHVIEMAFTAYDYSDIMKNAIEYAYSNGVFLVAAAGNAGNADVSFPASHPNVFAVGATDDEDIKREDSNYGENLDLCAPGDDIVHLIPGNNTEVNTGRTSAASAMVSGTAALILSVNPDLTNIQVADILRETADKGTYYEYDYEGHSDYIGHGRLNAYRAVCLAGTYPYAMELYSDETWDSDKSIMNSVYIKNGVTLTITSKVEFDPDAKLIVEPGGILIIDGGKLTNMKCCNNEFTSWPGIEVWGNRNASQYTAGAQGKLILINEATIENAVTAVDLWKPGDYTYTSTGGIIEAEDAIFINNARSIHAVCYRNFNPNPPYAEMDYFGTFTDCSFIISNENGYEYLGDVTFNKHIDLDRVRGIKFYGCTFSLDHTAPNVSQWNMGIAAYNAGFNVLPTCSTHVMPCPLIDSCRFNGFNWAIGVWAPAQLIDPPILITNAHFDDNSTGVYINDHDYAVILENFFEAGYDGNYHGNCDFADGVGIDIHQSNGFVVENNKLRKNSAAITGHYAGIRVSNCPSLHDIIYKNEIIGLSFGNYAEGTNRSIAIDDATGVEYRCNFNYNNAIDFIVKNTVPYDGMIRGAMGNQRPDTACGNFFSPNATWHIRNEGTQTINWFYNMYNLIGEKPLYIYELNPMYVNDVAVSNTNGCPNHYGGGTEIRLTQEARENKETEFAQNLADYNSVQALYESLIDGGNTEAALSEIQSAESDEMWTIRTHLLGMSPHLSQEVLRAISDRTDVFPDDVLLDILSANPDELDKDTLLNYLEQKEDPLPDYMLEILSQVANGVTYKTILQEEMAYHYAAKTQAAQDIIRSILNDTVFHIDDYRDWLDNLGGLEADKQIIASYLYENDTTSALGLLEIIPDLYDLEGQASDDFNDYKSLIELQIGWNAEGKSLLQLDSLDIAALEGYAINGASPAGTIARNIFEYINYQHYCNCLETTDSSSYKSSQFNTVKNPLKPNGFSVSVEPNPADTWIAFNYELPDDKSVGLLSISDASGKLLIQTKVTGKAGQKVVNTEALDPGLYFYTISVSGLSKAGKFIIQ